VEKKHPPASLSQPVTAALRLANASQLVPNVDFAAQNEQKVNIRPALGTVDNVYTFFVTLLRDISVHPQGCKSWF
jgi:hypothetical protein